MSYKNSAAVNFNNNTEIIIRAAQDGTVESCFNRINQTEYVHPPANIAGLNPVEVIPTETIRIPLTDTDFSSWTPSTTQHATYAAQTIGRVEADYEKYDYVGIASYNAYINYTTPDAPARVKRCFGKTFTFVTEPYRSLAGLNDNDKTHPAFEMHYICGGLVYLNSNSAPTLYQITPNTTNSSLSGFYIGGLPAVVFPHTSDHEILVAQKPNIAVKCNSTYFSTAQAAEVDVDNSYIDLSYSLYKVDAGSFILGNLVECLRDLYLIPEE